MSTIDPARWRELSPHLDHALELTHEARAAWLQSLHAADPVLAADLRILLAQMTSIERKEFLEGSPAGALGRGSLIGQSMGAYTLDALIGHGGMGSVWLARRSDGQFEGRVAIKVLNAALIGDSGEIRFRREGRMLARLTHANIARILDAGISDAGQPYLVLEYIEGSSIDRYCDERRLGISARLELFLEVLAAVTHAHANLIVHRDIKPSNILVTRHGAVKLLDFGIAKLIEEEEQAATVAQLTRAGGRMFTPRYAAPEQLLNEQITVATDVYALGVLLYLLLAGRQPIDCDTSSPLEYMRQLVETEPERLSAAVTTERAGEPLIAGEIASNRGLSPVRLQRALRGDLDNIVACALRKAPADRYATVSAFADDVRRYLGNSPVHARPNSAWYRTRKFIWRNRIAVGASTLALTAIFASLAFAFAQMIQARAQRDEARYEAQRATASSAFMSDMFEALGPGGKPLPMRDLIDHGLTLLEKQYGEDPRFTIDMLLELAGRYLDIGESGKMLETLGRAESRARALGDPEQIARVQCNTAQKEVATLGSAERPRERMRDAERQLARMTRRVPAGLQVDCAVARAFLAEHSGDFAAAIAADKQVLAVYEQSGQTNASNYASALGDLARLNGYSAHYKEAVEWNIRAEQADIANGRADTVGRYIVLANRAAMLFTAGEVRRAAGIEEDALRRFASAPEHIEIPPSIMIRAGSILARLERYDDALRFLRQGKDAAARQLPSWEAEGNRALGSVELALGRRDEARQLFEQAESYWRANTPDNRRQLTQVTEDRARLAAANGRVDEGRALLERVLRDLGFPQDDGSPYLGPALLTAAALEVESGRWERAETLAAAAVRVTERTAIDVDHSADVGEALLLLARARLGRGDRAGARAPLERAVRSLTNGLGPAHSLTVQATQLLATLRS